MGWLSWTGISLLFAVLFAASLYQFRRLSREARKQRLALREYEKEMGRLRKQLEEKHERDD